MMKKIICAVTLLFAITYLSAQNTVAKFKYEDAEKAFYEEKYEDCISLLDEAEKLLGKTAPNILHLKIVAQYKLFEKNPYESYEALETLRNNCDTYLANYDIAGLEEKYRDVYDIQNTLSKYPGTIAEFIAVNKNQKQEIKTVFENYIKALGGREALSKVKSLYQKGDQVIKGVTISFEEKVVPGKKSRVYLMYPRGKKKKSKAIGRTVSTEDMAFTEDMDGNRKPVESDKMKKMPSKGLFPEMEWVNLINDPHYQFELERQDNSVTVSVVYKSDDLSHIAKMICTYDAITYLSKSKMALSYPKVNSLPELKSDGYTEARFENFEEVGNIKLPFKKNGAFVNKTDKKNNSYTYVEVITEILINQGVEAADFE